MTSEQLITAQLENYEQIFLMQKQLETLLIFYLMVSRLEQLLVNGILLDKLTSTQPSLKTPSNLALHDRSNKWLLN